MKASTLGLGLTLALAAGVAQAQTPPPMQVPKAAQAAGPVLSKSSLSAKGADAILDTSDGGRACVSAAHRPRR